MTTRALARLQRTRKLLNPGPYFSVINLLLTQGRANSPKQRKRNYFIPGRPGKVPQERRSGEPPPQAGREARPLPRRPAEPSPRAGPGTAPRLPQLGRRDDPSRRPGHRPRPGRGPRRPGAGVSFPPGPSSLLSHRRSPPGEGNGQGRGGPRRPPSAPAQPRVAAEDRGAPAGPGAATGEPARPLRAAA